MVNNQNNSNSKLDENNLFYRFSRVQQMISKLRIHERHTYTAYVVAEYCEKYLKTLKLVTSA